MPRRVLPDGSRDDKRGKAKDRRVRKVWMLHYFGDGASAPCTHCKVPLDFDTIEADRIKPGGSYARSNIQPSCRDCNIKRSDNPYWRYHGEAQGAAA
jgi:hypothetical protein